MKKAVPGLPVRRDRLGGRASANVPPVERWIEFPVL
jgi:hypothetical protein